jgi:hypothetical protein
MACKHPDHLFNITFGCDMHGDVISVKNESDRETSPFAAHNTPHQTSTSQPAQQPASSCNTRLIKRLSSYLKAHIVHDLSLADRNIVPNPILISGFSLTSVCVHHVQVAFTFYTTTRSAISRPTCISVTCLIAHHLLISYTLLIYPQLIKAARHTASYFVCPRTAFGRFQSSPRLALLCCTL